MATTTAPSFFNPTKDQGKALLALWQPTQGSQPAAAAAPKPNPPRKRARKAEQTTLPDLSSDSEDEEPANKKRTKNIVNDDDDDDDDSVGAADLDMSDPEQDGMMSTGPNEGAAGAAGKGFVLDPTVEDEEIRRQFALLEAARTGEPPHKFPDWYDMHLLDGDIEDEIMPKYIEYLKSRGVCTKSIDYLA